MSAQELDRCEIDQLSIDDKIKAAVKSAGFSTILNLLAASENEIFWKTGLPSDDITLLIDAVTEASSPKGISGLELLNEQENALLHITTGCLQLDALLHGGIPVKGLTEIAGESGSGKTQLALQLALNAQLPERCGGICKEVAYICTEAKFPSFRLQQMISGMQQKYPEIQRSYADHIYIDHITEMDDLLNCIQHKLPNLVSKKEVGLIVLDSVAAIFRKEKGTDMNRSRTLQSVGYKLHQLISLHNVAVITLNQVSGSRREGQMYGLSHDFTPALGLAWANLVTTRLMLSRTESYLWRDPSNSLKPGAEKESNCKMKNRIRNLEIVFCPWLPRKSASFVVKQDGLNDVDYGALIT